MTEEPKVDETMSEENVEEPGQRDRAQHRGRAGEAGRSSWPPRPRPRGRAKSASGCRARSSTGVQRFGQELTRPLPRPAESDAGQGTARPAPRKVADDVQKTDVVEEVRKGILVGLEAINRELGKMLERLETEGRARPRSVAPVTDTAGGETVVVAETPVVPGRHDSDEEPRRVSDSPLRDHSRRFAKLTATRAAFLFMAPASSCGVLTQPVPRPSAGKRSSSPAPYPRRSGWSSAHSSHVGR